MAQNIRLKNARITYRGVEFIEKVRRQVLRIVYYATELLKRRVVENLSQPTRTLGPSKEGEFPHADTGRLRNSIFANVDDSRLTGIVGTNLFYGICVFGSITAVATRKGARPICGIKVGDEVLTQTGEFRKVIATQCNPAIIKPDLVEITVPWRSDRDHVLTLTDDHKVLVCRDGLNKWVPAGELTLDDAVMVRSKKSWSEGTSTSEHPCLFCKKTIRYKAKFCSVSCRIGYWTTTKTGPHIGAKRSDESRAKMSAAAKARHAANPDGHPNRIMGKKGFVTSTERAVEQWLVTRGLTFEKQKNFDSIYADFYVDSERTIYEADGSFWHRDQAKDIVRDQKILAADPTVKIVHLHFHDDRFSPKTLDPNPLPGVSYVRCNPGPDSFADPKTFDARKIKAIRKWNYLDHCDQMHEKGSPQGNIYCLTVEGIHSFVAAGIVIANCLEYGTEGGKIIKPVNALALSWIDSATGERRFAKWVRQGAIRGRSYLRRSLLELRPQFVALFRRGGFGGQFRAGATNQYDVGGKSA